MTLEMVWLFMLGVLCTFSSTSLAAHPTIISEVLQRAPMPCEQPGFFRHQMDCRFFYRCVNRTLGNYQRYLFSCPFYTVFDPLTSVCVPPFMTEYCDTVDPPAPMPNLQQYYDRFSVGNSQEDNQPTSTLEENPNIIDENQLINQEDDYSIHQTLEHDHFQTPTIQDIEEDIQRQKYREEEDPVAIEIINSPSDDYEEITGIPIQQEPESTTKKLSAKPKKTYKEVTTVRPSKNVVKPIKNVVKPIKIHHEPITKQQQTYKEAITTASTPITQASEKTYKSPRTKKPIISYKEATTEEIIIDEDVTTELPHKTYKDSTTEKPTTKTLAKKYHDSTKTLSKKYLKPTQPQINKVQNSKYKENNEEETNAEENNLQEDEFQIVGGPIDIKTPNLDKQEDFISDSEDQRIIKGHGVESELDESDEITPNKNILFHHFTQSPEIYTDEDTFIYDDLPQEEEINSPKYHNKVTQQIKKHYRRTTESPSTTLTFETELPSTESSSNYGNKKVTKRHFKVTTVSPKYISNNNKVREKSNSKTKESSKIPVEVIETPDYDYFQKYTTETLESSEGHPSSDDQHIPEVESISYLDYMQHILPEINSQNNGQDVKLHPESQSHQDLEDTIYEEILNEFQQPQNLPKHKSHETDIPIADSSFYEDFSYFDDPITYKPQHSRPTRPIRPTRHPRPTRPPSPTNPQIHDDESYFVGDNSHEIIIEPLDKSIGNENGRSQSGASYRKKASPSTTTTTTTTTTTEMPRYHRRTPTTLKVKKDTPRTYKEKTTEEPETTTEEIPVLVEETTTSKPRYAHRTEAPTTPKPRYANKSTHKITKKAKSPFYKDKITTEQPEITTEDVYEYYDIELNTAESAENHEKQHGGIIAVTAVSSSEDDDVVLPDITSPSPIIVTTMEETEEYENLDSSQPILNNVNITTDAYLNISTAAPELVTVFNSTNADVVENIQHLPNTTTTQHPSVQSSSTLKPLINITPSPNTIVGPTGSLTDRGPGAAVGNVIVNPNVAGTGNTNFVNTPVVANGPVPNTINENNPRNPLEPPPLEARDVVGTQLKRKLKD